MDEDWQANLESWLAPYLEGLSNKTGVKCDLPKSPV